MIKLADFYNYLLKNQTEATANHYESGLRAVSKDMLQQGIILKPLDEMNLPEFEIALFSILHNDFFINKNTVGKRMYSNSLKQYQLFLQSTIMYKDIEKIENLIISDSSLIETEKQQIIKARKGQGIFRERIIKKYSACIISGIQDDRLLIASHVKPWRISNNQERLDSENGLLLSSLYDKMFDIGLITFENSGKIQISSSIHESDKQKFGLDSDICYDIKLTDSLKEHLEYHRDIIFVA